jgi:ribosomal 50S subunit-associated protein YjgA (DUF615 family)
MKKITVRMTEVSAKAEKKGMSAADIKKIDRMYKRLDSANAKLQAKIQKVVKLRSKIIQDSDADAADCFIEAFEEVATFLDDAAVAFDEVI